MDAVHFLLADKEKCDFFVTSDKGLLGKLKKLTETNFSKESVRVLSSQEFKNTVLKKISF